LTITSAAIALAASTYALCNTSRATRTTCVTSMAKPRHQKDAGYHHKYVLQLNQYLGYDFNTVEFAVRDGIPYAIDFCNPAPDAEVTSVGQDNFEWVVETAASYAIERAKAQKDDKDNLTWGEFVKTGAAGKPLIAAAAKTAKADVSAGKVDHAITEEAKPKKKAAAPKKAAKK
jgi:hypothetical protein